MNNLTIAADFLTERYKFNKQDKAKLLELFQAYHNPTKSHTQIPDERTAAAYVLARGLSIGGVLSAILMENQDFLRDIKTIADYGGGPGTFLWSFLDYAQPEQYINIDINKDLLNIFSQLQTQFDATSYSEPQQQDYFTYSLSTDVDLAVFSYTLCENKLAIDVIKRALKTSTSLLVVEPGTPLGSDNIYKTRQLLIDKGFTILAPCSHQQSCPLQNSTDNWCHFIQRVNRTKTQMFLKNAEKSYEDEKYIYLLATKDKVQTENTEQSARIISKPTLDAHILHFDVCDSPTPRRIKLYKKSDKQAFKTYKKASRGDLFHTGK